MTDAPPNRITIVTEPDALGMVTHEICQQHPEGRMMRLKFKMTPGIAEYEIAKVAQAKSMDHLARMPLKAIEREMNYALDPLPNPPKTTPMSLGDLGLNEDGSAKQ
jgi:hypothetical protein